MDVYILVLSVLSIPLVLGLMVSLTIRFWFARPSRRPRWDPALDSHILGSDYRKADHGSSPGGIERRNYHVPKDPQAYAKIFVPDGQDRRN